MTTDQTYERMRKLVDDAASLSFTRRWSRLLKTNRVYAGSVADSIASDRHWASVLDEGVS